MTDTGAARAERDNQEAMEWAMLILADGHAVPDPTALDRLGAHQAAFSAWVAADPSRETRYLTAVREMLKAGSAATALGMRSRQQKPPHKQRGFLPPCLSPHRWPSCSLPEASGGSHKARRQP